MVKHLSMMNTTCQETSLTQGLDDDEGGDFRIVHTTAAFIDRGCPPEMLRLATRYFLQRINPRLA